MTSPSSPCGPPKIKAHVARPMNVAPIDEAPGEPDGPPTVWVEMHHADSDRARVLTGQHQAVALIFERDYGSLRERLVGYLRREDMVHLHRFFDLGDA